jgi:hypothetical protein
LDLADGLRIIHGVEIEDHFGHIEHLRFAWALLDESTNVAEAERVAKLTIRHVAEVAGNPAKYHSTITVFWIRMLAYVKGENPQIASLDEALDAVPDLRDPDLPSRYWSNLDSTEARERWIEPDLATLP